MADAEKFPGGYQPNDLTSNAVIRQALGASFAEDTPAGDKSALYDRVRPIYPQRAFDAIVSYGGIGPGNTVLEIGCGPGKATRPLAERGLRVTALDPSTPLIEVARRNLQDMPTIRFMVGKLEEAGVPNAAYDAVVAAQSIHWVDPVSRWSEPHRALKPGGMLAFMSNFQETADGHQRGAQREKAVNDLYQAHCPQYPPEYGSLERMVEEQADSGLFGNATWLSFHHDQTYSREDYLTLQRSLSWVSTLSESARAHFLGDVEAVIGNVPTVVVPWRTELVLARKS